MKKTLLILLFAAASATTFAQGKVTLINDAASLVVFITDTSQLKAVDMPLAGQPVGNLNPLPSGVTLVAGLYGGTSWTSLFLYSSVSLNNQNVPGGYIPATHIILSAQPNGAPAIPGIANGTAIGANTPWFQVKVWDSAYPTFEAAFAVFAYAGLGPEFQMNPGASLSYPNTAPTGVNSTWVEGNIILGYIPEPSGLTLIGLGAAMLLAFRRNKGTLRERPISRAQTPKEG